MSKYLDDSGLGYFWSQLKTKLAAKQDTLVSGTNIKTVNNNSLLGSGDISLATLASPTFTGTPTAPTATAGTNTTQIATTAFVKTAIDNAIGAALSASY